MTSAAELNATLPYATPDELAWLSTHAHTLPVYARVAMIGAGPCVMALAILEGRPDAHLYILDPAEMNYCKAHIRAEFPNAYINYLQAHSREVTLKNIDFLVIDGSHEYAEVLEDARAWLPRLAPGASAFFHDYDATGTDFGRREQYPGVKRALDECLESRRFSLVGVVGTAAIVRRK